MRLALLPLALAAFAIGTSEFVVMGVLPELSDGLAVTIPEAGRLISAYAIGVVVGAPVLTAAASRVEHKRLLLWLLAMFTAGNVASTLAPNYEVLIAARFVSGLPHGAFFGVGAIVAAGMVAHDRRARAIALMMAGLTVSNVIGVPLGTLAAQQFGWRTAFAIVVVISAAALVAIAIVVPAQTHAPRVGVAAETRALLRPAVWLTLLTGAVGFGGLFAFYSYVAPMMTDLAGFSPASVTIILALLGTGMTLGNFLGGRLADWKLLPSLYVSIAVLACMLAVMYVAVHTAAFAAVMAFVIGVCASTPIPMIQTRLLDVASDAPTLASSLHHSAFNVANANGAWLGGLAIGAGFGLASPNLVGAGLALLGLVLAVLSGSLRSTRPQAPAAPNTTPEPALAHTSGGSN
ncbi:MFS transporter [Spiractinospora alimapuensis]|uniref:MFS transporter n=1 Tax=Spiractinospora alimapuensis TaxID=2820884 RepID=UPI001F2FCA8F|nr:MFS transporter [Spiractinospora alimapuensis]QVQ51789.1 MFS transporter [Spiractinospora alimapuensis]